MKKFNVLSWSLVFLWMALIFFLSAQSGADSGSMSGGITGMIVGMIEAIFPWLDIQPELFHTLIRKSAHFFAYFVLGILTLNALCRSGTNAKRAYFLAFTISVLYAASDEFHQSFVPGRGPAIRDVLIDSAGAAAGLFVWWLVTRVVIKVPRRFRKSIQN